jgi:hypothetical protein
VFPVIMGRVSPRNVLRLAGKFRSITFTCGDIGNALTLWTFTNVPYVPVVVIPERVMADVVCISAVCRAKQAGHFVPARSALVTGQKGVISSLAS